MNLDLAGKRALVTGSSRGLGLVIAKSLAEEGSNVVLNGRDTASLERAVASVGDLACGVVADVTDARECERLVAAATKDQGTLDILVCNVGSGRSVPPSEETDAEWRRVLDLNLLAATNMVSAACRTLNPGSSIVCISSIAGLEALGAPVTYSAAKAALHAYVRGIARPLAREGIRINAVASGNLLFPGSVWDRRLATERAAVERMLDRDVAIGRLGDPHEVANFVVFLASARASFATGATFVVDGGQVRS